MRNLLFYQPVRLKTCLSWSFRGAVAMLQEFLRRGKNGRTNLIRISGRVPVLNLEFAHGRSRFQPTVENLPKGRHGSGGFCGGFFDHKIQKKNPPENPLAENKNFAGAQPPKSNSEVRKSAAKPTNRSACQTSKDTPGFFRLRMFALGGVFRAWILGHSLAAFWA